MATIRLTTTEIQVDDIIYTFNTADQADAFEACVATVDVSHCEKNHTPVSRRPAEQVVHASLPAGESPAENSET